jgi:superfamily II DNA or RNA helicase
MVTFARLRNGWGISGPPDEVVEGAVVEVRKRDGGVQWMRVGEIVEEGRGWVKAEASPAKKGDTSRPKAPSAPAAAPRFVPDPPPDPPEPAPKAPAAPSPEGLLTVIESLAPPKLQAWIAKRRPVLLQVIAKIQAEKAGKVQAENATHAPAMLATQAPARMLAASERVTFAEALDWLHAAARQIAAATRYDERTGAMIQDETGASYATHAALGNYQGVDASAPIQTHLAALEAARTHSHTQLDREDFERAAEAIQAEARARGIDPADVGSLPKVYHAKESVKSGLSDGSRYKFDEAKRELDVRLPYRKQGPSANDLLRQAGIPREAYRWFAGPGETYKSWLNVDISWAGRIADALSEEYPELAAAIRQNLSAWAGAGAGAVERAGTQTPQASLQAFPWEWDAKNYRLLVDFSPHFTKGIAQDYGVGFTEHNGRWVVYVVRDLLTPFLARLEVAKDPKFRATADVLAPHVAGWLAEVGSLKQTKESGQESGGSWSQPVPGGPVEVEVTFLPRDVWDELRKRRGWSFQKLGYRKVWVVAEKNVPKFADILRKHEPLARLAEALNRAFGGVAQVTDKTEKQRAQTLGDFNRATVPADVQTPEGIDRLRQVYEAFERYGPHGLSPLDFQWIGAAAALEADFRFGIFDSPGLGKTVQALLSLLAYKHVTGSDPWPVLVVCPANVVFNWQIEARKWLARVLPSESIRALDTSREEPTASDAVVIVSWDYLSANVEKLARHGFIFAIFDEAHYAKNFRAKRSKAFQQVAEAVPHVLTLTGTPIKNVISELFPLLTAMHPDDWGEFTEFKRKFAVLEEKNVQGRKVEKDIGGVNGENLPELRDRLNSSRIRRTKTQVLTDLPPKSRRRLEVDITKEQRAEYKAAEEQFLEWLRAKVYAETLRMWEARGLGRDPTPAEEALITQAAIERVSTAERAEALAQMTALRKLVGKFKAPAAAEIALDFARRREPVLFWAHHDHVITALAKALDRAGVAYAVINGATPKVQRSAITAAFQNGRVDIILASSAAKEGLTLTRAAHAVFVERYWTPADEQQAEDRIHRIGQVRPVEITRLHVGNTIDTYMDAINMRKASLVEDVLGDEEVEAAEEEGSITDALAEYTKKLREGMLRENPRRRHVG